MKGISRRSFMAASAVATAGACATGKSTQGQRGSTSERSGDERPNVLIIYTDQQRIECLGAYGNREIATPHIDAIAADGVRFTNSFCPYPVCTPSRYSLISGLYVHEHRGWSNHCTLPPEIATFPAILKKAGYHTKAVGKLHYTPTYLDIGFSEMVLAEQNGPGRWDDDYHRALRDQGLIDSSDLEDQEQPYRKDARPEYWPAFGALPSNLPLPYHSTQWIGDRAEETVRGWAASGELLSANFIKPHHPFDPPAEYCGLYDPEKLTPLPGWTDSCFEHDLALNKGYFPNDKLTPTALRRVMAYYYANIQHIDDQVGRMVRVLKESRLYDNTLIMFTSDHGEFLGHHHLLLKSNYMYDPLVKVPLIVKFPQNRLKGTVSHALVNSTDVAPTILAQTGCAVPPAMRGLNLAGNPDARATIFAESNEGHQVMARTQTRKLILYRPKGVGLFYDLERDPCELDNRYNDPAYRDEIKSLTAELDKWQTPADLTEPYVNEDASIIDQPYVPDRRDNHRKEMMAYTAQKMREATK